jgi:hypothetical protein
MDIKYSVAAVRNLGGKVQGRSIYGEVRVERKQYGRVYMWCKVKGKAIPLQAWTGPEGPRRLRFPDFKTIGT